MDSHCPRLAPGRRRLTAEHLRAAETAARFQGLPAGVSKGQLLAAFKRAAAALGIPARCCLFIDTLMSWSEPQDWEGDSRPLVWPSNRTLEQAFGLSTRQVQNTIAALIRCNLVATVDSTDGHRWGKRDKTGRIVRAYGFDLSPLAVRYEEFVQVAERAQKERAMERELRRRLTIASQSIRQIAEAAIDYRAGGRDWITWKEQAEAMARGARTKRGLAELQTLVEHLERLRQDGESVLASQLKPVETAPAGAVLCTPTTTTNQRQADKSATCNGASRDEPGDAGVSSPPAADDPIHGLSPRFLARLSPALSAYLADERPSWPDIVTAAEWLRSQLGVSRSAWIDACHTMGRERAAAAVAVIAAKGGNIRSPGGYLRGMTERDREGRLNLHRSLWGLAEKRYDA